MLKDINYYKFHKTVRIILLLLFTKISILLLYYYSNATFYGNVRIQIENIDISNLKVKSKSPLNRDLTFYIDDNYLVYEKKRFYKNIYLIIDENISIDNNNSLKILFNDSYFTVKISEHTHKIDLLQYHKINENIFTKIFNIFKFGFNRTFYLLISTGIFLLFILAITHRKTLILLIIKIKNHIEKHKTLTVLIIILSLFIFSYLNDKMDFSNYVVSKNLPDQVDYQSCAVNHLNGHGFLVSGNINKSSQDYKIIFSDKQSLMLFETIKGVHRLDRFPAYPFLVTTIYKIFGIHPIAIKIFQYILLVIMLYLLPFISTRLWNNKGYWAALIATPLLYIYLLEYVWYISPDLISVFLNFFIIYLYIEARRNMQWKHLAPLAILFGLSILFKSSLMFLMPFMFLDFIFKSIKARKAYAKKILTFGFLFALCWIPYNVWSISKTIKYKDNAKIILDYINNNDTNIDLQILNNMVNERASGFGFITGDFLITSHDIEVYKEIIKPEIKKKNYVDKYTLNKLNTAQRFLSMLEYTKNLSSYFFIINLTSKTGALSLHNEYNTDGLIHSYWVDMEDSFYNNDGLSHKSDIYRMINFYYHNPKYIFTVAHFKLLNYFTENFIIFYLIVSVNILFIIQQIHSLKSSLKSNAYLVINMLSLITVLVLLIKFNYVVPYLLFLSILALAYTKLKRFLSFPIILVFIAFYAFPIIGYGNPRFMIYYDTYMFLLFGIIIVEIISMTKIILLKQKTYAELN